MFFAKSGPASSSDFVFSAIFALAGFIIAILWGTGVYVRHTLDSLDLDEIRYDCEKSVLFEGGKKLVWPKVFARTKGMPVQSVSNRIARKKLNVEVKYGRIYVACE